MLTNRQIAIAFSVMLAIGGSLFALVWRVKGNWGFVVGILGALIIIFALKWLQHVLETRNREEKLAKKLEEDARFITKYKNQPEAFVPAQNPALRKKLLWIFGSLMALGFGLTGIGLQLHWPIILVSFALPLGLWSAMIWASIKEKFNPEKPSHDFSFMWGKSPAFRRNNILLGLLMNLVIVIGATLTPPPPNSVPTVIVTFVGMFIVLLCQVFYIQFTLQKEEEGWSLGEKRLERVMDVSIILLLASGYPVVQIFLPNLIHELYFSMLFAGGGLIVGYFVHDYLKNKFTGFFDDDERKWAILLKVYVGCLILTLCIAAIVNQKTAVLKTQTKVYKVTDKSSTYKGKSYLWLEIGGKNKRFEPKKDEWEKLESGDSTKVLIGTGILGFDYILKFEPAL